MKFRIFIEALCVETRIGICDWEKALDQQLYFDIDMWVQGDAVAKSDAIDDALDYAAVAEFVEQQVVVSSRLLLEPLLADLGEQLLARFESILELQLTVRKPLAIGNADCAGVSLNLSR